MSELTDTQRRCLRRTLHRLGDQRASIARHLRLPEPVTERERRENIAVFAEVRSLYRQAGRA